MSAVSANVTPNSAESLAAPDELGHPVDRLPCYRVLREPSPWANYSM